MIILSVEQVLLLHQELINQFGGQQGIRDKGLLESACSSPFQSFDGIDMYPSIEEKGAHLCYSLVMDHPFIDGNKRIGIHAMLVFFELNQIHLQYTQEELYTVILQMASANYSPQAFYHWIVIHKI